MDELFIRIAAKILAHIIAAIVLAIFIPGIIFWLEAFKII